jgi:integrase
MPLRSVWKIEWKDSKDAIFRDRPAALITREDILARLNAIRRVRGSYAARHALDAVRRIFSFAANHGHSGIKVSPAASLRDKSVGLTGSMMRRQRILTEGEIKSVWRAATDAGVFGVLVKTLLATSQRRDDWAEAKWSELSGLDSDYPLLTVPAARYKVGRVHEVPLSPLVVDLLRTLPRLAAIGSSPSMEHIPCRRSRDPSASWTRHQASPAGPCMTCGERGEL